MKRRTGPSNRHAGLPIGNKHKAHRAIKSTKKCAAYLNANRRELNRDRRFLRLYRGMRRAAIVM